MKSNRSAWLLVIPLLLLVFWLSARMLDADLLWNDEVRTYLHSGLSIYGPKSIGEILDWMVNHAPNESPGYFLLLGGWATLVGATEFAVRTFSLLLSFLTIAWMYRLGRDMVSPRVGLYAAVALGSSSLFIHYAHEARQYMPYALMTCITIWAYRRIIAIDSDSPLPMRRQIVFFVALVGAAYTHWLALLSPIALDVYHLLFVPKNRRWWRVPVIMALAGLAFAPWFSLRIGDLVSAAQHGAKVSLGMSTPEIIETLLYTFSNGNPLLLILLAGYTLTRRERPVKLVWTWLIAGLGAVLVINLVTPSFIHIRYMMAFWPALALMVGIGVERLSERKIHPAFLLGIWLLAGVWGSLTPDFFNSLRNSVPRTPRAGFAAALDILDEYAQNGDLTVIHMTNPGEEFLNQIVLEYYMDGIPGTYTQMESATIDYHALEAHYRQAVSENLGSAPFVWVMTVPDVPFTRRRIVFYEQLEMDSRYARCETVIDRDDMQMQLYARRPDRISEAIFTAGDNAESEIELFKLRTGLESGGETLDVLVGWSVGEAVPVHTYSVGLHIVDAAGELVTQVDYGLPDGAFECRAAHIETVELPPGEYTLLAMVYDWQTNERLPVGEEERVLLGTFTVR